MCCVSNFIDFITIIVQFVFMLVCMGVVMMICTCGVVVIVIGVGFVMFKQSFKIFYHLSCDF